MKLALEAPPLHTLAIAGRDERFPVNRVFCVGRNYAAHAREMGKDPTRESFIAAMETLRDYDVGGYYVTYTPSDHNGSKFVDLTVIGKEGRFLR